MELKKVLLVAITFFFASVVSLQAFNIFPEHFGNNDAEIENIVEIDWATIEQTSFANTNVQPFMDAPCPFCCVGDEPWLCDWWLVDGVCPNPNCPGPGGGGPPVDAPIGGGILILLVASMLYLFFVYRRGIAKI